MAKSMQEHVRAAAASTAVGSEGGEQDEQILKLSEVAQLVDRTAMTVGNWCKDGLLECVRLPSGLRGVPLSAVRKFIGGSALAAKLAKLNGHKHGKG